MYEFFTNSELSELRVLKYNLTLNKYNYFFKPLDSFAEFKGINLSMLSMQGHHFYTGLLKDIQAINSFFNASYFLLTGHLTESKTHAHKGLESSFSGLVKMALTVALLFLGCGRLSTLLVSTFVAGVADACKALAAGLSFDDCEEIKNLKELVDAKNVLLRRLDDIHVEKLEIGKKIKEYSASYDNQMVSPSNPNGLFVPCQNKKPAFDPARHNRLELIRSLHMLLTTYPRVALPKNHDIDYVKSLHKNVNEHHATTIEVAARLFETMEDYLYTPSNVAKIMSLKSI